jgi:predicted dehydrogenase
VTSVLRLRIGVLGLSHDHVWSNLESLARSEYGVLAAVAEPDPALRRRLERSYPGVVQHSTYEALLGTGGLDGVMVFADNRTSVELGLRALGRGLPVMIEKPMAADLAGADALLAASQSAGLPLMVNWPTAWRPALRHGLRLVQGGAVGEPIQLSHRGGHAGPREFGCSSQFCDWLYDPARNGGGALVDYCGYGTILARTLLGVPTSVVAVAAHLRKPDLVSEDNAVVILRYARALALLEGSWTQIGGQPAYAMIVYGDGGTVLVHQPRAIREGQAVGPGRVEVVRGEESEMLEPPPLGPDERDGVSHFLARLRDGKPFLDLCSARVGRDAQQVLDAALRSAATGREIPLA